MSKVIAVTGSPGSGKTTTAVKIAQEIQAHKNGIVLYVSLDWTVPSLSYIFPQHKSTELFSIGKIFDLIDIYKEDVLKQTVTTKEMPNLGYLGFKSGENRYSYPFPTEDKIISFFEILKSLSDFVIVDCTNNSDDIVTEYAIKNADRIIEIISPDLKGITYLSSIAKDQFTAEQSLKVINITYNNLYLPIQEVKKCCDGINTKLTLPFSSELEKQAITGTLSSRLSDKRYTSALSEILKEVI